MMDKKSKLLQKVYERLQQIPITANRKEEPTVGGSAMERFMYKVLNKKGVRPDLCLCDWKRLDRDSAVVTIAFVKQLGYPSLPELQEYLDRAFPNVVFKIYPETAKVDEKKGVLACVIKRVSKTRPYDDAQVMRQVTASTFLDVELGEVWRVEERDGTKYLAKVEEEDVETILKPYVQKIKAPVRASVYDVYAGVVHGVGDIVEFYADGETKKGEVTRYDEVNRQVTIKTEDGKTYTVPQEAVYRVLELGGRSREKFNETVEDYFGKIYGDELAKKLTRRE